MLWVLSQVRACSTAACKPAAFRARAADRSPIGRFQNNPLCARPRADVDAPATAQNGGSRSRSAVTSGNASAELEGCGSLATDGGQAAFRDPPCGVTSPPRRHRWRRCRWRAGPGWSGHGRIASWCADQRAKRPPEHPAAGPRRRAPRSKPRRPISETSFSMLAWEGRTAQQMRGDGAAEAKYDVRVNCDLCGKRLRTGSRRGECEQTPECRREHRRPPAR